LQPNQANGLTTPCSVMLDKITTVRRSRLGHCIVVVFLGMAG
jgi:hypothetical protein